MKATCFALLVVLLLGISCDALSPFRSFKKNCCERIFMANKLKLGNISSYRKTAPFCKSQAYIVDIKGRGDLCFEIKESITNSLQEFDQQQKNGKDRKNENSVAADSKPLTK
ncbi:hypothetical protein XENTR_v10006119 [Xenopus tropicalis]|nr:hypothetical protein XENTR_v10006119 [Xenopus tropicalis]